MTQNGLPIARPTPNTSQSLCESSCRWTVSNTVLGWGSRPLVFFARYLAGRLERPAVLPCVAQTGVVSPVGGDQAPGITRGVSFRVRGQSSPHRATQRLSAGRARDHPVMEIVPNKALSLSLSLSLSRADSFFLVFGGFAFLPFSLGPAGDCPCRHYVRGESWLP